MQSPTDDVTPPNYQTGTAFPEPVMMTPESNSTITDVANGTRTLSPTDPPTPVYYNPGGLPWGGPEPGQNYSYNEFGGSGNWSVTTKEGPTETYVSGMNLPAVFVFVVFICLVALAAFLLCGRLVHQTRIRSMNRKNGTNTEATSTTTTEEHLKTVPYGSTLESESSTVATYPTSYAATFAASSSTNSFATRADMGRLGRFGGGYDAGGGDDATCSSRI